nr:MAG TPA: hypothetical protein [Caudoviricetes sp.]
MRIWYISLFTNKCYNCFILFRYQLEPSFD